MLYDYILLINLSLLYLVLRENKKPQFNFILYYREIKMIILDPKLFDETKRPLKLILVSDP